MSGFNLVLGNHYNDFWFNRQSPEHDSAVVCGNCKQSGVTIDRLEKLVQAFGKLITKTCTIYTCPYCLHEELADEKIVKSIPATKKNFISLFAKLPKSVQQKLLTQRT